MSKVWIVKYLYPVLSWEILFEITEKGKCNLYRLKKCILVVIKGNLTFQVEKQPLT